VSESSSVSLRNQKSAVLAVNYRRWKAVFRRVSVVSGVRSLTPYLVVSCCVSQLVIVICAVIISVVNKSGIQSERRVISHTTTPGIRENIIKSLLEFELGTLFKI
jgi:hypothetical protein